MLWQFITRAAIIAALLFTPAAPALAVTMSQGPASATANGYVTTGAQTLAGNKTLTGTTTLGVVNITALLTQNFTAQASTAEILQTWGLSDDATALVQLINASSSDGTASLALQGIGSSTNHAVYLIGQGTTDTGSNPIVRITARIGASTLPATRPLFGLYRLTTLVHSVNFSGKHALTPNAVAGGAVSTFAITPPGDTQQTASTQINGFVYNTFTRSWNTGAITTQREFLVRAPTYAFGGASTITDAATLVVDAAPIAGTNATITRSHALWVQAGTARFDGGITLGQAGPQILAGSGSPEGVVTAVVGSTYHRTDGGAGSSFYVKESGSSNTGWIAK